MPAFPWYNLHDTLLIRFEPILVFLMFTAESLSCFTQNLNTIGFPCTIRYERDLLESNTDHNTLRKKSDSRYQLSPNRSKRPSEQSKYGMMYQRTLTNARNAVMVLFVLLDVHASLASPKDFVTSARLLHHRLQRCDNHLHTIVWPALHFLFPSNAGYFVVVVVNPLRVVCILMFVPFTSVSLASLHPEQVSPVPNAEYLLVDGASFVERSLNLAQLLTSHTSSIIARPLSRRTSWCLSASCLPLSGF